MYNKYHWIKGHGLVYGIESLLGYGNVVIVTVSYCDFNKSMGVAHLVLLTDAMMMSFERSGDGRTYGTRCEEIVEHFGFYSSFFTSSKGKPET